MGLFSRKGSKNSISVDSSASASNGSLKSPGGLSALSRNGSTPLTPNAPQVPIPRPPDAAVDPAGYLRSIHAVRERSRLVLEKATKNQLRHFTVDMSKFQETAGYVVSIIKVNLSTGNQLILKPAHRNLSERLRTRLCFNSPAWEVAALRRRWTSAH